MRLSIQDSPYLQQFAEQISYATTPFALANIQTLFGNHLPGINAMVSLAKDFNDSPVHKFSFPSYLETENIVPYFYSRHMYFLNDPRLIRITLGIDYSISLDTNAATYIKTIVKNKSLNMLSPKVKLAFEHILEHDFNFDSFFYFVENAKQGIAAYRKMKRIGIDSSWAFWKLLNKKFRRNAFYIELFRAINCKTFRKSHSIEYEIGPISAMREVIKFVYGFYCSDDGQFLINERLLSKHRSILFQLIAMYRIQFSSKMGARAKFRQFLKFVQDEGEVYFDREFVMIYKYFAKSNDVAMFKAINLGGKQKNLMKTLSNLAWDLTALRFMEMMCLSQREGSDFLVPYLLSFDKNMCTLMRSFPIKTVLLNRSEDFVLSFPQIKSREYFYAQGCKDETDWFFSPQNTQIRHNKLNNPSIRFQKIRREYKRLRKILDIV